MPYGVEPWLLRISWPAAGQWRSPRWAPSLRQSLLRSMRTPAASVAIAWLVPLFSAAAHDPGESSTHVHHPIGAHAGDSVRIMVWRKPQFGGDFVVAPDASITGPLLQAVKVGGPIRHRGGQPPPVCLSFRGESRAGPPEPELRDRAVRGPTDTVSPRRCCGSRASPARARAPSRLCGERSRRAVGGQVGSPTARGC